MTPEQIRRAKAIIEHAAVHSLETEEIQLLGWALQRIEELEAGRVVVARGKLLPCPCCGGDAEFAKEEGGGEYIENASIRLVAQNGKTTNRDLGGMRVLGGINQWSKWK